MDYTQSILNISVSNDILVSNWPNLWSAVTSDIWEDFAMSTIILLIFLGGQKDSNKKVEHKSTTITYTASRSYWK